MGACVCAKLNQDSELQAILTDNIQVEAERLPSPVFISQRRKAFLRASAFMFGEGEEGQISESPTWAKSVSDINDKKQWIARQMLETENFHKHSLSTLSPPNMSSSVTFDVETSHERRSSEIEHLQRSLEGIGRKLEESRALQEAQFHCVLAKTRLMEERLRILKVPDKDKENMEPELFEAYEEV